MGVTNYLLSGVILQVGDGVNLPHFVVNTRVDPIQSLKIEQTMVNGGLLVPYLSGGFNAFETICASQHD